MSSTQWRKQRYLKSLLLQVTNFNNPPSKITQWSTFSFFKICEAKWNSTTFRRPTNLFGKKHSTTRSFWENSWSKFGTESAQFKPKHKWNNWRFFLLRWILLQQQWQWWIFLLNFRKPWECGLAVPLVGSPGCLQVTMHLIRHLLGNILIIPGINTAKLIIINSKRTSECKYLYICKFYGGMKFVPPRTLLLTYCWSNLFFDIRRPANQEG